MGTWSKLPWMFEMLCRVRSFLFECFFSIRSSLGLPSFSNFSPSPQYQPRVFLRPLEPAIRMVEPFLPQSFLLLLLLPPLAADSLYPPVHSNAARLFVSC